MSELQNAFREAARREFAAVPAEAELDYIFSAQFERRMQYMIRAQVHGYLHLVNTAAKRFFIAAAILFLLLSSVLAIKPVRQRVIQFFVEAYEEYFEIRFGEKDQDDIDPTPYTMERYTLTYLPEGYEETALFEWDSMLWTEWCNARGNKIVLTQEPGTQEITLDAALGEIVQLEHNGLTISYQKSRYLHIFVWEQDGYIFQLAMYSGLSVNEGLQMIDFIKK